MQTAKEHYVIQLDSDILFFSSPTEVLDAVAQNIPFISSGDAGSRFLPMSDMHLVHADERADANAHVQTLAEIHMSALPDAAARRYVRGCSGLYGLPSGQNYLEIVETFSQNMIEGLGKDSWNRWGSEQVASNMLLAAQADTILLPCGRYTPAWYPLDIAKQAAMHFVGSVRFQNGNYRRALAHVLNQQLMQSKPSVDTRDI